MALDSLLISHASFAPYPDVNQNIVDAKKLNPYILQAQLMDLKSVLGEAMYWDLMADYEASPALQKYVNLYNGSVYQLNGNTIKQEGLIPVLCYFTYSRYILNKQANDTAYGFVSKKNEYSEPVDGKIIKMVSDNARSIASAYMQSVIKYLDHNKALYPLWKNGCGGGGNKRSIIITGVER